MTDGARRIGSIGLLTGMLLTSAAGAVVKTTTASNNGLGSVVMPLFDPRLGTLLSVYAEATYTSSAGYISSTTPFGYDHAVTGTASLGSLTFAITGASQATQLSGYGIFTVTANGNVTWTDPSQLGLFSVGSPNLVGSAWAYAAPPGSTPPGPSRAAVVNYNLSYIYEDGTPAVPEPATWAMMAGGFALVGAALRAARRGRANGETASV